MEIEKKLTDELYYDAHGVSGDIMDEDIEFVLDDALREDILIEKRKRRLRNISI